MILAVARTHFAKLKRDRAALVLSFVLPVVFFTVFASLFGGGSSSRATTRRIARRRRRRGQQPELAAIRPGVEAGAGTPHRRGDG